MVRRRQLNIASQERRFLRVAKKFFLPFLILGIYGLIFAGLNETPVIKGIAVLCCCNNSLNDKEVEYQEPQANEKINEQNVAMFLHGYPAAVIEEIISGNKYVLSDLLSRWERRRFPEEKAFWEVAGYKIGMMLRVNPELLLEAMAGGAIEKRPGLGELFYPDEEKYQVPARIYLLKERIKALSKVNKPDLKEIKSVFLSRMQQELSSLKATGSGQKKTEITSKNQQNEILREQIRTLLEAVPEPILKASSKVQNCPCRENIRAFLKALKGIQDKETLSRLMRTYYFGRGQVFLFSADLDLLQEEALAGTKEAVEVLLYFYLYGDEKVKETVGSEIFVPLIRVRPRLFLEVIKENRNMFYAAAFPVDAMAYLPQIAEVCVYFLNKRAEALDSVKDEDLTSVKEVCLSLIKRKIEEVSHSSRYEKLLKGTLAEMMSSEWSVKKNYQ